MAVAVLVLVAARGPSTQARESDTHQWHNNTVRLMTRSENADGGFSLLTDQRPVSLYDTLYNLQILHLLGHQIPMKQRLATTLAALQYQQIPLLNSVSLLNLYYEVATDRLVGVQIKAKFRAQIANELRTLPRHDGLIALGMQHQNLPLMTELLETQTYVAIARDLSLPMPQALNEAAIVKQLEKPPYSKSSYIVSGYTSLAVIERVLHPGPNKLLEKIAITNHLKQLFSKPAHGAPAILNAISAAQLLRQESMTFSVSEAFKQSLHRLAATTGGYTLFSPDALDPKLTYQLMELFHVKKGLNHVVQDILKTQLPDGLFGWNSPVPSDPMDSYWAVGIFRALGYPIPRSLRLYFRHTKLPTYSPIATTWAFDKARNLLGMPVTPPKDLKDKGLTDTLTWVRTLTLVPAFRPQAKKLLKAQLGILNSPRNQLLENIFLAVSTAHTLNYPLSRRTQAQLVTFIQSLQKPNGGFAPPYQHNGDLTNTYYCVTILSDMYARPLNMVALQTFLQHQRNPYGGYAASDSTSTTSLQATYDGVEIERLLSNNHHGGI